MYMLGKCAWSLLVLIVRRARRFEPLLVQLLATWCAGRLHILDLALEES